MICTNEMQSMKCSKKEVLETFVVLLSPFAPHICEELWELLGHKTSVCDAQWPECNEEYLKENTINYCISFNGKVRYNVEFPIDADKESIEKAVLADERSLKWMEGKSVVKIIIVPKKIVNIVIK